MKVSDYLTSKTSSRTPSMISEASEKYMNETEMKSGEYTDEEVNTCAAELLTQIQDISKNFSNMAATKAFAQAVVKELLNKVY